MELDDLFCGDRLLLDVKATSKKQLLQVMAETFSRSDTCSSPGVETRDIVLAALERERLGSTGVGSAVALPHARIKGVKGVHAAFARLETPLDFDSVDDRPVDLVAMLVAPEDAGGLHLRALARVSRLLRREDVRNRLRAAPSAEAMHIILSENARATAA